jgi:hypothetical protein
MTTKKENPDQNQNSIDQQNTLHPPTKQMIDEINNQINFILGNSQMLKEVWKDVEKIIHKYNQENGDLYLGGIAFQHLRELVPRMLEDIIIGSMRISNISRVIIKHKIPSQENQIGK